MKKTKNILIYRLGSLGDTVMALPCFNQIKNIFPNADITLLTNKPVASVAAPLESILGTHYFFHRTLTYPVGTRNPALLSRLILQIRALNIDTVINLTALRSPKADRRDRLFFKAAGIQRFIGFDAHPADYAVSIDPDTGMLEWEAKRLARKIESLGAPDLNNASYWDFHFLETELDKAKTALAALHEPENFIVLNIGTKMPVKDWGKDNWKQVIIAIASKFRSIPLVMVGVKDEKADANDLLSHWQGETLNLCGKTSPRVSAAILEQASIFIGHDSGPMHLAAAVGTPCVALFSCINQPAQWYPRGENHVLLFPDTACAKNGLDHCVEKSYCVRSLSLAHVTLEIENHLQRLVLE